MDWLTFIIGLVSSLVLVPVARIVARRVGMVAQPRDDRWHNQPTPYFGGVAIFLAFVISIVVTGGWNHTTRWLLLGSAFTFILGLVDDFIHIAPQTKLIGLFLAASLAVLSGNITYFFPWAAANIAVSILWMVGIANALNLLDNMDGLASGTALVVAAFMAYFFWRSGNGELLTLTLAIAGATLGFFIYNFPPASIFMGDSGSLFLGLTLAALAISRGDQASNVLAVVGVPTLIFLLPILDTAMVTLTRLLRGQSPAQGGRDHTSHRLVALGLSERQTLLVLMGVALLSGLSAIFIESLSYNLSLVLIPVVVLVLTLFSAYLGQLKIVDADSSAQVKRGLLTNWIVELTYRRRVLEVILDFFLIAFAYYLAHLARLGTPLSVMDTVRYLGTLPYTVVSTYAAFFVFGVYRGVWQYVSIDDAFRVIVAVFIGAVLSVGLIWAFYSFEGYSGWMFFIYALILIFVVLASRFSFRLLDRIVSPVNLQTEIPVLIYGAGAGGAMALRECQQNKALNYHPVGFLDDDPLKAGRSIHGLSVLGRLEDVERMINRHQVRGIIIASRKIEKTGVSGKLLGICKRNGVWLRKMHLEFEEYS
ncbi:MAG: hypothetical protein FJ010_11610 [Chloroflexi bacterium]|nr:hypothetical protein [Chloroflexota bacterium]